MSNVIIDRGKIDILANAISDKSGVPVTMTLDEMLEAVDSIETGGGQPNLQAKTYTVDSAGTATVTADSGYDGLSEVEVSVPSAMQFAASDTGFITQNNNRKWKDAIITVVDPEEGGRAGWLDEGVYEGVTYTYNAVPSNTSITPTESAQTIGGAYYMMEGAVTVNPIPSNYVGTGITRRDSTDIDSMGALVMIPNGFYNENADFTMPSGTAGTPTATKGTVSNHSVSVTPSVTNTTGYITGGTKNGTAVTVSASELVSGTYTVSASGTHDVTNYASASVASGSATASATKGTVSNHSVTVTPSVTRTAGYITAGSANGTAVTVSASELVSGSETKTENGTYDVTNLASLVVACNYVTCYKGSSAPSSSLGNNGDLYFQK